MTRSAIALPTACVAALALFAPASAAQPFWIKCWTVTNVLGPHAAVRFLPRPIGKIIELRNDSIVDPTWDGCASGVSYADVKLRPRAEIPQRFGPFWRLPGRLPARVTTGWVRCERHNYGPFVFVSPDLAYRLFEDGLVLVLK